jgi:hypothetical protein
MTLDIDRMLTEDAETWRASLPPGAGPAAVFDDERRPRGSRHRMVAVAASVAAVLLVAGVGLGIHWSSSTNPPTGRSFSGPCQDDFVAGPSTYRRTAPPSFQNFRVTVRYRGSGPCRVSAYGPYFEMRDASGNLLGVGDHSTLEAVKPDYLIVQPGDSLALAMRWIPLCPARDRVATAILHLDGQPDRSGVGVEVSVPPSYTPTCDRHVINAFGGFVELPRLIVGLTAAQRALALQIAHEEARTSVPGGLHDLVRGWPANVHSVSAIVTTATDGAQYVGGSTAASGKVLVIRLTGRFDLVTKGPPGSADATGNELTVLAPLDAKRVSDGGVETHHPPADLPNSTNLFRR